MKAFIRRFQLWWNTRRLIAAGIILILGLWLIVGRLPWSELSTGLFVEILGVTATVLAVDLLIEYRARGRKKKDLILQLGSADNAFAREAIRQLRAKGWLTDGTLRNTDLSEADLNKADLSKAELKGVFLTYANLNGAYLINADLSDANLSGASLEGAYLINTDLSRAELIRANLKRADLTGARLDGADLTGANLAAAKLTEAQVANSVIEDAVLPQGLHYWTSRTEDH